MNHINFARVVGMTLLGAGVAFGLAFSAYLGSHPMPDEATAKALLANMSAATFEGAQKGIGAGVLALICVLTRSDANAPANGLRPADAPIAETQQTVGVEMGEELLRRLAAEIAKVAKP